MTQADEQVAIVWHEAMTCAKATAVPKKLATANHALPSASHGDHYTGDVLIRGGCRNASMISSRTLSAKGGISSRGLVPPTPFEVKPGVAAERALQLLRVYVRKLRIRKDSEDRAEE